MENPASWGPVEKAIDEAIAEHVDANAEPHPGISLAGRIAKKLRSYDLLKEGVKIAEEIAVDAAEDALDV